MEKDEDGLVGWLTRVGKWAGDLAKDMSETMDKTDPARAGMVPKASYDAVCANYAAVTRQRTDLERMIDRSRTKLQRALERYHGAESRPTANVPFDQMIETVVKTIDGEIGQNKGFPKQVAPTNDAQVDSLRSLIRDMELQQVADTRLIAEQARTIERLQGELEHAREPMA
jgi:hypothetical protein